MKWSTGAKKFPFPHFFVNEIFPFFCQKIRGICWSQNQNFHPTLPIQIPQIPIQPYLYKSLKFPSNITYTNLENSHPTLPIQVPQFPIAILLLQSKPQLSWHYYLKCIITARMCALNDYICIHSTLSNICCVGGRCCVGGLPCITHFNIYVVLEVIYVVLEVYHT